MNCNLCGNEIVDLSTGGFIEPFGEVCGDCLTHIYGENYKEKQEFGCFSCGYRTSKEDEVERFKKGDFFCCATREEGN
jgi:hypothetical protein